MSEPIFNNTESADLDWNTFVPDWLQPKPIVSSTKTTNKRQHFTVADTASQKIPDDAKARQVHMHVSQVHADPDGDGYDGPAYEMPEDPAPSEPDVRRAVKSPVKPTDQPTPSARRTPPKKNAKDSVPAPSPGDSEDVAQVAAGLLDEVVAFVRRYVVLPADYLYDAVALWILHAHAVASFDITPRLAFKSPEKQSGKSKALSVLEALCPNTVGTVNISTAALFHVIDQESPTILFDEVDSVFTATKSDPGQEELRGLLNAGFQRGTGVWRSEPGRNGKAYKREVFAAVALACIGALPDTLESRSIIIPMRRRTLDESIESFRVREVTEKAAPLVKRLAAWAAKNEDKLRAARPEIPKGIDDRAADCWEPLLAIADLFGPLWSARARQAAVEIAAGRIDEDQSTGVQLLLSIREVFTDDYGAMHSSDLVTRLNALEEAGYKGWNQGKGLNAGDLAHHLKKYGIKSKDLRAGPQMANKKGYARAMFEDAWKRYAGGVE